MTDTKEPIFDEQGWCYDLSACPVDKEIIISFLENDICKTTSHYLDNNFIFSGYQKDEVYAWRPLPTPAKLPEPPKVFVTGKEALRALLDGKVLKQEHTYYGRCFLYKLDSEKNKVMQYIISLEKVFEPTEGIFNVNETYELLNEIPSNT